MFWHSPVDLVELPVVDYALDHIVYVVRLVRVIRYHIE